MSDQLIYTKIASILKETKAITKSEKTSNKVLNSVALITL